jgi:hypothetical protein
MVDKRKKKLFDENGKLKPIKKKKSIELKYFLDLLKSELGLSSKWDSYEYVCKTTNDKTCCWVNDRKDFISLNLLPPYVEKWKTIRIYNKKEAENAVIMLKAKINGYSEKLK